MTPLTDALRRMALHQDIPECAQAADRIERLEGLVAPDPRRRWSVAPADVAARAAAVAEQWPGDLAEILTVCSHGSIDACCCRDNARVVAAVEALLADRERLRGLVDEAHRLEFGPIKGQDGWWTACVCGDEVPFASKGMPTYEEHVAARAAHVAAILDGGGA